MTGRMRGPRDRPLYMISVAAELAGVHPQTLRIYERKRLVHPVRSGGNTRLYSDADIDRLRQIQQLTQEEGVNLAGVIRILQMQEEMARYREETERLRRAVAELKHRVTGEAERARRSYKAEIVLVQRGDITRK